MLSVLEKPKKKSLFQISDELQDNIKVLESEESPERQEEILDDILLKETELEDKIDSYCGMIAKWGAENTFLKKKEDYFVTKRRQRERWTKSLKENLKIVLEELNQTKVESDTYSVSLRKNSVPTVEIVDSEKVTEEYNKVTTTIDKQKAAAFWKKEGVAPAGFKIEKGIHVRIA